MKRDCCHPVARHVHGTTVAYNHDACRCQPCRDAKAAQMKRYRRENAHIAWRGETRMVTAVGIRRRIEALAVLGWSANQIGQRLGVTRQSIDEWRNGHHQTIGLDNWRRFVAVLDRMEFENPPEGTMGERVSCRKTANRAARFGYKPTEWWANIDEPECQPTPPAGTVDMVAVRRRVAGFDIQLTPSELDAAIVEAVRVYPDLDRNEIAERIGVTPRDIARVRERLLQRARRAA